MDSIKEWVVLLIGSNALFAFVQFLITRQDNKKNIKKELDDVKAEVKSVKAEVKDDVANLSDKLEEHRATLARTHILRFADDLKEGKYHSEEYFKQQILDIDTYNRFCDTHPDFCNGLTVMASEYIRAEYVKQYLSNDD